MEVNKRHAYGFLRFFKRDGSDGSIHPLEANAEYTIGFDSQATIRLKTFKSSLKPIQCVVKVDENGLAKLINKDIAHAVKLNNKPLYSSKYLLPNDVFFVLDKKIRYENQAMNKNNLMKLSSRNKVNTPMKSTLSTKGRKSYTVTAQKLSPNILDDQVGFRSLRGSRTPHVKKRLECFSTFSEKKPLNPQAFNLLKTPIPDIKIQEVQSPRRLQSRRTSSRRCSTNKKPVCFCMSSSSGGEEMHGGFHISPLATKLDDLNTPPNNKSIVEINLTPIPSVKKRKSQKFAVVDDSELQDTKTPKTTLHFRNSLHLFSGRKSRKSSLSNALSSISEDIGAAKKLGPTKFYSVTTPRNATPKLNETYSEGERSPVEAQETTTGKSGIKLNETYSEEVLPSGDEQEASGVKLNETYSEEFLSSAKQNRKPSERNDDSRQRQTTPKARKSLAELNETFTEEKVQVRRPVARKSLRKLNKTFSDADFPSVREQQQMYSPALVNKSFGNFVKTTSDQNSTTPILSRKSLNTSTVTRPPRQSSVTENSPFFKISPRSSISNITFRRPLRNVTSTYRLSQENIILVDSDLEHSQNSPQENQFFEKVQSPLEKSFSKVFHSSPRIKTSSTNSISVVKLSLSPPQLEQSSTQLNPREDLEQSDVCSFNRTSLNEGESSEDSSLVKQLTLVLSDEDLAAEDEHDLKVNVENLKSYSGPKQKQKRSSLSSLEHSSLKGNNSRSPSLLETTASSSFYYERPSVLARENITFFYSPVGSRMSTPENNLKVEQNSTMKRTNDSRTTTKNQASDLADVKRVVNRSPKNDLTNVVGVRRLLKTPREPKQVNNDLSDVRGVRKLMATPKIERSPLNDLTQVKGLKKLMRTPKPVKAPKNDLSDVAGVRRLMESPRERKEPQNDLSDVRGVRKLMSTPKEQRSPLNDITDVKGVKRLMRTPRAIKGPKNDLSNVTGVRRLMESPRERREPENDLSDVRGVRKLMSTPKEQRSPLDDITDVKGVKRLMRTPRAIRSPKNDLSNVAGVRRLMESPQEQKEPENDLGDVRGVRRLLGTPKEQRSPLNDLTDVRGVKTLLRTPKHRKSVDLSGLKDLMMTPVFNITTSSNDGGASSASMGDFDALLNKKPVRTYRGKSQSPFKSPKTSDYNDYVQPDVVKWVEEQDNYLQSHSKDPEMMGTKDSTPNKEKIHLKSTPETVGGQDDLDEIKSEIESVSQSPQYRSTRRRRKVIQTEESDVHEMKTTRSKSNLQQDTKTDVIKQSGQEGKITRSRNKTKREAVKTSNDDNLEELAQEIKTTRNKRTPRNKLDLPEDVEGEETKSPRNRRLAKIKQEAEEDAEITPGRSLRGKPQLKEEDSKDDEPVQETRATRSRSVPKNQQQIEENVAEETTPARTTRRLLLANKAQVKEESGSDEVVEKSKPTRSRRLPKNKQQIEDDSEHNAQLETEIKITEDDLPEVEDKLPNNKVQGTRANTRSRRHIKDEDEYAEPKKEVKTTRSRRQPKTEVTEKETEVNEKNRTETKTRNKKQQKKNEAVPLVKNEDEDEEDEANEGKEEKGPSPKLLRTRKRKVDYSEDTDLPAEQALVKKTRKIVTFDVDSPRRSNRTPRKLHRIADEEFEFDVDKISVGHSKRATKKTTEKIEEEDAAAPEEPRRSRRTRK